MERVVVTGAAGFIGGHCCRLMLRNGWQVVGIDNFDPFYPRALKESTLAELASHQHFGFVEADVRDRDRLDEQLAGAALVIHLAAKAGVRPSIANPEEYTSANVGGTISVLESCRRTGVRRVIFASSSSVYGNTTPVPFREDAPALDPISPYAATKRAGELLCRVYAELHGFRIAALRFFTVYGPRQRPDLAIHRFTRLLSERHPVQQFGDGSMERDHTHVDDVMDGVAGSVRWVMEGPPALELFNLGEARTVRLDRLIELIAQALGVPPLIERLPVPPGDVQNTWADITKARTLLGYAPQVGIEDGIRDFVNWFQSYHPR